jgi:hypothetical protein
LTPVGTDDQPCGETPLGAVYGSDYGGRGTADHFRNGYAALDFDAGINGLLKENLLHLGMVEVNGSRALWGRLYQVSFPNKLGPAIIHAVANLASAGLQ